MTHDPQTRDAPFWPTSMPELAPAERFIVWSLRRWIAGMRQNDASHICMVHREFVRQVGRHDAEPAMTSFAGLIRVLMAHARRRIRLHAPCCPCLCTDEAALLCILTACQGEGLPQARHLVEQMVDRDGAGAFLQASTRLASILKTNDVLLPDRTGAAPVQLSRGYGDNPTITYH